MVVQWKATLYLMFVFALTGAGLSWGQALPANEVPPDALIVLQRGGCEDRCAVYRIVIFADGTVIYDGRYFVRKTGLVESQISSEAFGKLLRALEAGRFFALADRYGFGETKACQSVIAGGPNAILTVSSGGRSKTVLHQHGCTGEIPDQITALEDKVDQAVGAARWIR